MCLLEGNCTSACEEAMKDVNNNSEEDDNTTSDDKVKSGKLVVTNEKNEGASVLSYGYDSELDTINFSTDEEITLNSITLERFGLSTAESIDSIWLEDTEGNIVTSEKSLSSSKDTVTLSLKKEYKNIDGNTSFIVVVKTIDAPSSDLGTNVGFKVVDIDSTAETTKNNVSAKANLYAFADYTGEGVQVAFKGNAGEKTYNYSENEMYEVAKFKVTASSSAIEVNGFTLANKGNLKLEKINDVEILVDGTAIKSSYTVKNDDLQVSFAAQEIAIKKSSTFTVRVSLADYDDFGSKINMYFDETSDLNVVESKNSVRVKIDTTLADLVSPTTYIFNGSKIVLTNTKINATVDAAQDSDDVTIAKGTIAINGQSIKIPSLTINPDPDYEDDIESIKLVINGDSYEFTSKKDWTVRNVTIDEDADVEITADVASDAISGHVVSFVIGGSTGVINTSALSGAQYENDKSAEVIFNGSISISKLKVQAAKASFVNNITKKAQFKVKETTTNTVFEGVYTAKKGETKVNEVVISKTAGTINTGDTITFNVYLNGSSKPVASADFDVKNTADANETFSAITVDAGADINVRVDATVYATTGTESDLKFTVQLKGEDTNGNDVNSSAVEMVNMEFVDSQAITVTTNAAIKEQDIILANSNQTVAKFLVKPGNKAETATLDTLTMEVGSFDLPASANFDDYFRLTIGGTEADNVEIQGDGASAIITVEDLNENVKGEVEVELVYKKELTANTDYEVVLSDVNGKNPARTFKRKAVNAIVRVISQTNTTATTKYRFDIDYSDNANNETIASVTFTYKDGNNETWTNVQEAKDYSYVNTDKSSQVETIEYTDGD
ncbi:hypothetical protein IJM86_07085 [bacterium]|nr:hypothetical protein [bacterium]